MLIVYLIYQITKKPVLEKEKKIKCVGGCLYVYTLHKSLPMSNIAVNKSPTSCF